MKANSIVICMAAVAIALAGRAPAQSGPGRSAHDSESAAYDPAKPSRSVVVPYPWRGYGHRGGATPASAALHGMASVISAAGDYNLATSAAAVNMTQAQRNAIQNRQQWTRAYFDLRETNREARAAERGPAPSMEQIARIAHQGVPEPLSPSQLDPVTGRIEWPGVLLDEPFEPQRAELERLFAHRVMYGGLSHTDYRRLHGAIGTMLAGLKEQVDEMPPMDYIACKTFLKGLDHAAMKEQL